MEDNSRNKNKIINQKAQNLFEKDINNSFENRSPNFFDFNFEPENKITEGQAQSNILENKNSEEADLDEIIDVLNEMNKAITIEIHELNFNPNINNRKHSYSFLNKNNNNINDNVNSNEFQEILSILKKPLSNKNIRNLNNYDSPFKPLLKPKKVSLVGKVFYSIQSEDANTKCESNKN